MFRRVPAFLVAVLVLCFAFSPVAFGQSNPDIEQLKKDVETLKNVEKAIIMELRAIRAQLPREETEQQAPSQTVDLSLNVAGAPRMGAPTAKVAIVEFTDFECPYCGRHFETTLPELEKDYVGTGKVVYIMRDFPLANIHPHALKAAEAARCAGDQGKFWDMHAILSANQANLEPSDLLEYAAGLNLDRDKFEKCLSSSVHAQDVKDAVAYGTKLGLSATPTFFIGRIDNDTKEVKATTRISGAYPYPVFKDAIDALLKSVE
jgi:protein-disulfide isomerase